MIDPTSIWSYDEIVKSGYAKKLKAEVLSVICSVYPNSIMLDEVIERVRQLRGGYIKDASVTPRMAQLEDDGFILKSKVVLNPETKKTVRTWKWTGWKIPLPFREELVKCHLCDGNGQVLEKVHYFPDKPTQGSLFQ